MVLALLASPPFSDAQYKMLAFHPQDETFSVISQME